MSSLDIRILEETDLAKVAEIFNHYVLHTTFNFHVAPLDLEQMAKKIGLGNDRYASYGIFEEEDLIGYSVLMPWKPQEAYRFTAEVSLYLQPVLVGKGYGKGALIHLESVARERGLRDLLAGVCTENKQSTAFFEHAGYNRTAFFPGIGNKFDRELDMIYLQKDLREIGS